MKILIFLLMVMTTIFSGTGAFAHGENKPGPHGGEIRMPGAFHTEVVIIGKNQLRVYLLDINFQNPTVKDSSVQASFVGHHKLEAGCKKEKIFFLCTFDKEINLKEDGEIILNSNREKQKGSTTKYKTPLKY